MPPPHCYPYPRPSVTVDLAVFTLTDEGLRSLFIRRKKDPFAGHWAIPGGFLEMDEDALTGAHRELREETGLENPSHVEPIGWFDAPDRDPRGRTISLAHAAVIRWPAPKVEGQDDASQAEWLDPRTITDLAFDHPAIVRRALEWLGEAVPSGRIGTALLPTDFAIDTVKRMLKEITGSSRGAAEWLKRVERRREA